MSLDNLTPATGAWLFVSLLALVFAILNLQSSRADVKASRLVHNYRRDSRLVIATGAVHRDWIKVGVFFWWALLGVVFGLIDPPRVIGLAGLLGLIGTAAGMAYIGFHEARERAVLADLLADDIADDKLEEHNEDVAMAQGVTSDKLHQSEIAQATVRAADRMQTALESTAANTERIAQNTERAEEDKTAD